MGTLRSAIQIHDREKDPEKVKEFTEKIAAVPSSQIAYVDETGIDSY